MSLELAKETETKEILKFIKQSTGNKEVWNINYVNPDEWLNLRGYRAAVFSNNYIVLISKNTVGKIDGVFILLNIEPVLNLTVLNLVNAVFEKTIKVSELDFNSVINNPKITKIKLTIQQEATEFANIIGLNNVEVLNFNSEKIYVYSTFLNKESGDEIDK